MKPTKVAVVGGGIAGLAAAWELCGRADVTVFEPGWLGGKLRTEEFLGHPVDTGPDAFIARVPDGLELCKELGLEGDLVAPAATKALLWWQGRLRALPEGLVLGAPQRLGPMIRSGLLSPAGLARAGFDLVAPPTRRDGDVAVRELVAARFGTEVADRLVDPLLGGIHAGTTAELSAEATAPQLLTAARSSRSLLLGLRRMAAAGVDGPTFLAPRQGMQALSDRLVTILQQKGVGFEPVAVSGLRSLIGGQLAVEPTADTFDGVVLAVPAARAAEVLDATRQAAQVAAGLRTIQTASVVVTTLAYRTDRLAIPAGASGFLVPKEEGRLLTACSFGSNKWPHWSDPGTAILRASAGRAHDDRPFRLDDASLVERVQGEIAEALGAMASPTAWRVHRWPGSFPQYTVDHLKRVATIEAALQGTLPRLMLAGASYRGSGIPACIASGRRAARDLQARLQDGEALAG
jgi:protoporphyrinogen/coproporphyrinogen III oxidase